jgi:hypothetical protein
VPTVQRAAAASQPGVAQAARDSLGRGGNAVDAVIAGVLVAAAEHASVLLGPLQLLAGGAGAGLHAVDGRARQPGSGIPRPRGFVAAESVPAAARVAVPAMPAALAVAAAALGSATLLQAARPAIAIARSVSRERARVLEAVGRRGAAALGDERAAAELIAVAGRLAHGLLTRADLSSVRPDAMRCEAERGVVRVPWLASPPHDASATHVVAAADGRGLLAVACYESPDAGLEVPALGLVAPLAAEPVLRGRTRIRPGEPRPAAAPIALRMRGVSVELALGVAAAADADASLERLLGAVEREPTLSAALAALTSGRAVAVVRTRESAVAY